MSGGRMMVTEAWDLTVADDGQVYDAAAAASAAALAAGLDPAGAGRHRWHKLSTDTDTNRRSIMRTSGGCPGSLAISPAGKAPRVRSVRKSRQPVPGRR